MQIQEIELSKIAPAESGERAKDVKSLAESIKAIGLIQPISVIPVPDDKGTYRIVAGHRRFAAMQLLKVKVVTCIVGNASEQEAQAIRISENMHRLPLTPLQEAEAIAKLRKLGRNTDEIAADLAMRPAQIARRERLTSLIPQWASRWTKKEGSKLTAAHMELIAAQAPESQIELLRKFPTWDPDLDQLKRALSEFNHRLSTAPWSPKDSLLVPKAGACGECPKRSSCQPLLFHDETDVGKITAADTCLDVRCWNAKLHAHDRLRIEKARQEHPGLIFVRGPYDYQHDNRELPLGKSQSLLEYYQYEQAKKGDKKARPAMIASGKGVGNLIFITTGRKRSSSSGSPARKSLSAADDRKARRGKIILQKINERVYARTTPKPLVDAKAETKLKMLAAVLENCHGDSKAWKRIGLFSQKYQAHAVDRIWDYVCGTIELHDHSFAIALEYIDVVRPFAEKILGLDWKQLEAEALKAVPDPKPRAGATSTKTTKKVKKGRK